MDVKTYELATKLLQHKAKTKMVGLITGISDQMNREIYKSLHKSTPKQGQRPSDAKVFFKTTLIRADSNMLASLFVINGLTQMNDDAFNVGHRFVVAYETYLQFCNNGYNPRIDINRAWMMLLKLREGELTFRHCTHCGTKHLEHYDIIKSNENIKINI